MTSTPSNRGLVAMRVALLHSPLTSTLLWRGVADALARQGVASFCIKLPEPQRLYPPYWLVQAATAAEALPEDGDVMLVAHSGAGVLLPAIVGFAAHRTRGARVASCVFVDCDLPRDGCSRFDLMSAAIAGEMRARCRDGWLARWTADQLAPLIADKAKRDAFVAELPQVPVELYEEPIPVPDAWPSVPVAYLALSRGYRESVTTAQREGWRLRSLDAHHLLPYSEPERVATELVRLLAEFTLPARA